MTTVLQTANIGIMKAFLLFLGLLILAGCGHQNPSQSPIKVRRTLELSESEALRRAKGAAESYRLPVSRAFLQGKTELCWIYATLSALESNYLVRNPGDKLELSRSALQYFTWEDRYLRFLHSGEDYLWERGTEVDAVALIQQRGLVAFDDFRTDPVYLHQPKPFALSGTTPEAQLTSLYQKLEERIGVPPLRTHYHNQVLSRAELANRVLGTESWEAYSPSFDGTEGYDRHWDPDARPETKAWYLPVAKFWGVIHDSLRRGHAPALSVCGHDILLYGADYGRDGAALVFYVKDSFDQPFYAIDPARIQLGRNFCGVTTIKQ